MKTVVWRGLQKRTFFFFLQTLDHFLKSSNVGRHFFPDSQGFYLDIWGFAYIFMDFAKIFRDFVRIFDKSKLLRVGLHLCLLHLCLQQTGSQLLFPDIPTQWKMYFFVPSLPPCMHPNYDVIQEGIHPVIACGRFFGCRVLHNLPRRASVKSHQVQCNIRTFEALLWKNVVYLYLYLKRCRKSNNVR